MKPESSPKAMLRAHIRAARDALPEPVRADAGAAISSLVAMRPEYRHAACVLGYMGFGSEFDTGPLMRDVLARGSRLLLPRVNRAAGVLELRRVDSLEALVPGPFGIREPDAARCPAADVAEADLVIVPGVAFDRSGRRLGYGAGYYDRLLGAARPDAARVAPAFAVQVVDVVPVEPHDLPVDLVVTEAGACGRLAAPLP